MSTPWHHTLAVFDLETTGIDVTTSRIVTAHVGLIDEHGEVLERFDWLADPGVDIPAQASAVHGVTTERARAEGRPADVVVAEIIGAIAELFSREHALVIYNAPYDLSLLAHEAHRHGVDPLYLPSPVVDPLVLDRAVDRFRKGKRTLEAAAAHYGVSLVGAHDAAADAIAAGRVAQALARRYPEELGGHEAAALHALQVEWALTQAASFTEYMRRVKDPSFHDPGHWPVRPVTLPLPR